MERRRRRAPNVSPFLRCLAEKKSPEPRGGEGDIEKWVSPARNTVCTEKEEEEEGEPRLSAHLSGVWKKVRTNRTNSF